MLDPETCYETALWQGPGIYFLMLGETVVYVGKSKCVAKRLKKHANEYRWKKHPKCYHWVKVYSCPVDRLDEEETYYIQLHQPRHNIQKKRKLELVSS